jgi:toxin YoeB
MYQIIWDEYAAKELAYWKKNNPKVAVRIFLLIEDITKKSNGGLGKPEKLKHNFSGYWSRRITKEHRLIYKIISDKIYIVSCKGHYIL